VEMENAPEEFPGAIKALRSVGEQVEGFCLQTTKPSLSRSKSYLGLQC
jgi:hypothetical protein